MGNTEMGGVIRTLAAAGLGWASAKGYISAGDYSDLTAALGVVFVSAWSIAVKRPAKAS